MNSTFLSTLRQAACLGTLCWATVSLPAQQLDSTWTLTAGGQTVTVNPDGSFRIPNISAADQFGSGGPGSRPDFISDEPIRITGQGLINGEVRYAFSEPFYIESGETFYVPDLIITPTPAPLPESLELSTGGVEFVEVGEQLPLQAIATLGDGNTQDVTPRTSWTTYRTSNPEVATVDPNGMVTGVAPGRVFLTASNEGTTAVKRIQIIAMDDPRSTIVGFVFDAEGRAVGDALVRVAGSGLQVRSTPGTGRFDLQGVPASLGQVSVSASIIDQDLGRLSGTSGGVTPVPGGLTDIGRIILTPSDSSGMDFVVAFSRNNNASDLSLFLASDVTAIGSVTIQGLNFIQEFVVEPGIVETITLPPQTAVASGLSERAVRITADADIRVYGLNLQNSTSDAFSALPIDSFGTDYLTLHQVRASQIAIVAAEDNTVVNITPPAQNTTTVTLPTAGHVYLFEQGGDVSGTRVTANLPIGVLSGNRCTTVGGCPACDHLVEMLPPVEAWGTTAFSMPLSSRSGGDVFAVLAAEDNTTLLVIGSNNNQEITLAAGEKFQAALDGPQAFAADKPVLVAQLARGQNCDRATGDPFMMILPPAGQYLRTYSFSTPPGDQFDSHFLNLIVPDTVLGSPSLTLDGQPLDSTLFVSITGSGFSGAQIEIEEGCHVALSPEPIGAFVYGWGDFDSYGYPGGMALNSALRN